MKCDDLTTEGGGGGSDGGVVDLGSNSLLYCTNFGVNGKIKKAELTKKGHRLNLT